MRWLPLLLIFLLAYIEISIFIKVAAVLGVAVTLLLVVFSSCVGISLVRNQGMKTFVQMQQTGGRRKPGSGNGEKRFAGAGGLPAADPGFLHRLPRPVAAAAAGAKTLTLKLMPHLSVYRPGGWTGGDAANGNTFDGEFQRKDDERSVLEHRPDEERKPHDR